MTHINLLFRTMTGVYIFKPALVLLTRFIPESPRWLTMQRRYEEAYQILGKIADKNKKPRPAIAILEGYAKREEARGEKLKRYSYLDLFRHWKYCKVTLICMFLW